MLAIDIKYVNLLSSRLDNFRQLAPDKWQFRCPICGDSAKSKSKARGGIYRKETGLFYRCFNCQVSITLGNLIKQINQFLYDDYVIERYKSNYTNKFAPHIKPETVFEYNTPTFNTITIKNESMLSKLTPAIDSKLALKYCIERKIPEYKLHLLYYTDNYRAFINEIIPAKFSNIEFDDERLVLPYYNEAGEITQFTGRALTDSKMRYIHVNIQGKHNLYGLDRIDTNKKIYVVEGQIDSLFIDNCIAIGGSDFNVEFVKQHKDNIVLIYDNEPRGKEIAKLMKKSIDAGYNVVVWNGTNIYKDINDMVIAGVNVIKEINENTYSGLTAMLKFNEWVKC